MTRYREPGRVRRNPRGSRAWVLRARSRSADAGDAGCIVEEARRRDRPLAIWLSLALAALPAACGVEEQAPEPVIRPVLSESVTLAGGVRERSFSGVAEATTMWNGSFKVPGTVESVPVVVGQAVAEGELIAQLDAYDYELEVQRAEAGLRQARANARNAAAIFERTKELYEDENATKADFDAALAADQSDKEAVISAEKGLELASRRRDDATLQAPFPGEIAEVIVEENENVTVGQVVVRMTAGDRRQVSVAFPETFILQVRRGDAVVVSFDAVQGRTFAATVEEVGVASTGLATTFPVTVLLDDETPDVRSGMSADVSFRFGDESAPPSITVPLASVLEDRDGHYVFVLAPGNGDRRVARRTPVTVGGEIIPGAGPLEARVEIASGLQTGDEVVTAGAKRIVDGQEVRLDRGRGGTE